MVRKNVLVYSLLQAAEYLTPILAIPIITRSLGTNEYGKIALIQAILGYFLLIVEFGFNYTGTRDASRYKNRCHRLKSLFSDVLGAKLTLFLPLFAASVFASILFWDALGPLLLISQLAVLANVINPLWILQGVERVSHAALISGLIKAVALVGLFAISVTSPSITAFALILFGSSLLSSLVLLAYTHHSESIVSFRPSLSRSLAKLRSEKGAFFSVAASSFYRTSNSLVLGFTSSITNVGLYSIAEKVTRLVQELNRPLAMATYPRLSTILNTDPCCFHSSFFIKVFAIVIMTAVASSATLYFLAEQIFTLVTGSTSDVGAATLRAISPAPLLSALNLMLGVQVMHNIGRSAKFARLVLIAGIFSIAGIIPMSSHFGAPGAAITYVASEMVLCLLLIRFHIQLVRSNAK